MSRFEKIFGQWVVKRRWWIIVATVILVAAAAGGLPHLTITNDTRVFFSADLLMILKNKHGQQSARKIRVRTLEVEGDGDKSLTIFDNPRDVKGTAFLTFSHKQGDDDQWLYLPALKRVKRISARNKSGSFVGSEFAYEDISSREVAKYTYRWIRNEVYAGQACFVIERYPVDKKNSGYKRQVVWTDSVLRTDQPDRTGSAGRAGKLAFET